MLCDDAICGKVFHNRIDIDEREVYLNVYMTMLLCIRIIYVYLYHVFMYLVAINHFFACII